MHLLLWWKRHEPAALQFGGNLPISVGNLHFIGEFRPVPTMTLRYARNPNPVPFVDDEWIET